MLRRDVLPPDQPRYPAEALDLFLAERRVKIDLPSWRRPRVSDQGSACQREQPR